MQERVARVGSSIQSIPTECLFNKVIDLRESVCNDCKRYAMSGFFTDPSRKEGALAEPLSSFVFSLFGLLLSLLLHEPLLSPYLPFADEERTNQTTSRNRIGPK